MFVPALILGLIGAVLGLIQVHKEYEPWRREQENRMRADRRSVACESHAATCRPPAPPPPRPRHRYNAYGEVLDTLE
jgi:hypothetical protein